MLLLESDAFFRSLGFQRHLIIPLSSFDVYDIIDSICCLIHLVALVTGSTYRAYDVDDKLTLAAQGLIRLFLRLHLLK